MVGARSARQGTGPFVAAAFNKLGAEVCAVVGTGELTVRQAVERLASDQGIKARGYTDLAKALANEQPDAVAICSPYAFHAGQLAQVAEAGSHCLVEKPLAWPISEQALSALTKGFIEKGLLLQQVTQWPQSLSAFTALHGPIAHTISNFSMRLSPISIGPTMVPDSAPHFISLLQALLGAGDCEQVEIKLPIEEKEAPRLLTLNCNYRHGAGVTRAQLLLQTCEQRPRPAWYQINHLRVDREVELPDYTQQLVSGKNRITLRDPIEGVVADFMSCLADGVPTDRESLLLAQRNLAQLASAWPEKA